MADADRKAFDDLVAQLGLPPDGEVVDLWAHVDNIRRVCQAALTSSKGLTEKAADLSPVKKVLSELQFEITPDLSRLALTVIDSLYKLMVIGVEGCPNKAHIMQHIDPYVVLMTTIFDLLAQEQGVRQAK